MNDWSNLSSFCSLQKIDLRYIQTCDFVTRQPNFGCVKPIELMAIRQKCLDRETFLYNSLQNV